MLNKDTADSSLASYWPEPCEEDPSDILAEVIERAGGIVPEIAKEQLKSCLQRFAAMEQMIDKRELVREFYYIMSGSIDNHEALRAECALVVMKKHPESGEAIGKRYGCSRANISKLVKEIGRRAPAWLA